MDEGTGRDVQVLQYLNGEMEGKVTADYSERRQLLSAMPRGWDAKLRHSP